MARACAKKTDAIFLKLAGPQLVQMFIGDGAKLVRDAFDLAKEKVLHTSSSSILVLMGLICYRVNPTTPPIQVKEQNKGGAIIFIDELDAIGTKRFGDKQSGDREVQRTMLELLNQLDGFTSNDNIKVCA